MKKLLLVFVAFFMMFTFVGCNESGFNFDSKFEQFFEGVNVLEVTDDLILPTRAGNLYVEWTSSNPDVLSNDGKVTNTTGSDVEVTLSAKMTYGSEEVTKEIKLIIKGASYKTINDALNAAQGDILEVPGIVVAKNAQSFLLQDSTGTILVFKGSSWSQDLEVGDRVLVKGDIDEYNGAKQFSRDTAYSKIGTDTSSLGTAKELTGKDLDNYVANGFKIEYVKITGILTISSGKYYNIAVEGANTIGSISYPISTMEMSKYENHKVEVYGYATGTASSNKFLNIMYTEIKDLGEPEQVEPTEGTIAEVLKLEVGAAAKATGIVVATNAQGFIISDSTAAILVFAGTSYAKDLVVGDKVEVDGTIESYGNAIQIKKNNYTKVGTDTVKYSEPKELTLAEIAAYKEAELVAISYVKVTGVLSISNSKYYNLTIAGAQITGSLSYPVDTAALAALEGKTIEVVGFVTNVTGSGNYLNIMTTSVKESGGETPEPDTVEGTIAEVKAAVAGSFATTTGVVVAVNAQSFLIKDETGMILVYNGSSWTCNVKEGDVVAISGTTAVYGNAMQFVAGSTYSVTGTKTVAHGEPALLTTDELDSYSTKENVNPLYVKVTGVLSVSSGKYFNVAISGATIVGSISYPMDKDALTALEGQTIEVVGYISNVTSSGKYLNIIALSVNGDGVVVEPEPEPDPEPAAPGTIKVELGNGIDGWANSYAENTITDKGITVDFSRVSKQTTTITDAPVMATGKGNSPVYATVSGFGGTLKSASFELVQWTTKTFEAIYIEYTLDGTTWVKCSEVITAPTTLATSQLPEGVVKVRLVLENSSNNNTQVGLKSVTIVSE